MKSILKVNDFLTITVYGYQLILLKLIETLELSANIFHGVDDDQLIPNEAHIDFYLEPFKQPGAERSLLCQFYYLRRSPEERLIDRKGFTSLEIKIKFPLRKKVSRKPGELVRAELRIFRIGVSESEIWSLEGRRGPVMVEIYRILNEGT